MTRILIDGAEHSGRYRCTCECGDTWNGQCEYTRVSGYLPALPVADCIVHMKLAHTGALVDVRFTQRFTRWLEKYWTLRQEETVTSVASGR